MSTRSKKQTNPTLPLNSYTKNRIENSWMMMIPDSLFENNSFRIITLPHPAHSTSSKYCLDSRNKKIYEVVTFSEQYRSWFIGETVKSDGSIMLVTPVNPIFLVLPRLRDQCKKRAVPLEDLLSEKGFSEIIEFVVDLDKVADIKGSANIKAYKYNEEKTLVWLESKIRKLATILREKNMHVTSGSTSATFVSSTLNNDSIDEEFYLKYAHGIISDYLQDDIIELLEKKFDFKSELIETVGKKRKSDANELIESNKKIKCISTEEITKPDDVSFIPSDVMKQKPLSAKEKARQKAASGTKTISSFFIKK